MINNSFLDFSGKDFLQIDGIPLLNNGIRWYAICILIGILGAYFLGVREARRLGYNRSFILDGVLICVPLAILGARLYYVIFDENKKANYPTFGSLFDVRNGGLAIMGGVIVAIIFVVAYCKIRKKKVLPIFDLLAPGLLIGQACGRWGNWFNGEAHGGIMSEGVANTFNKIIPWIMKKMSINYCDGYGSTSTYYHPTFLYESLWNIAGLIFILIARRKIKKMRTGDAIAFYMAWYGFGRSVLIEPFRTDQLQKILGVPVNILIPALMAIAGITWLILKHTVKFFKSEYYQDLLKETKDNKINTVVSKAEGVLVDINPLVKNAYYYTFKDIDGVEIKKDVIAKYVQQDYKSVLNTPEKIKYFNDFIINNFDQVDMNFSPKSLYKTLYKKNYHVVFVSRYAKEVVELMLEKAKIRRYVSVYLEDFKDEMLKDNSYIVEKKLFISNSANELRKYNKEFVTCLSDYKLKKKEQIPGVDHIVNNYDDVKDILLI